MQTVETEALIPGDEAGEVTAALEAVVAEPVIGGPVIEVELEMASAERADVPARELAAPESPHAEAAGLVAVLESLLFAAGAPVPVPRLVDALAGPSRSEVLAAIELLAERLAEDGRGIRLVHVAGGYQLRTATEHGPYVRRLLGQRPIRLSRPMLETLAIVAYKQPCTRADVETVRGVDVDAVMTTLLERRLVRIAGRKEAPGRPLLYATTREFLEVFGLPDLHALPPLRELGAGAALLVDGDLSVTPGGVVPTAVAAAQDAIGGSEV
ncbi:MAG: SMC-Scp complex subunit ScpB [Candidatus Binatia bacterium]